jgi:hypothetical protein
MVEREAMSAFGSACLRLFAADSEDLSIICLARIALYPVVHCWERRVCVNSGSIFRLFTGFNGAAGLD